MFASVGSLLADYLSDEDGELLVQLWQVVLEALRMRQRRLEVWDSCEEDGVVLMMVMRL